MASVYILHSSSIDKYYIGSCKVFEDRLVQHLEKIHKRSFTRRAIDWKLFFKIDDLGYEQSRKVERHIKSMKSRKYIENLKEYPNMVEKLKERF